MPKIVVYAIAKDEEASARAWAEAVKEADEVVVLDTGSTDKTPEILREYGFCVYQDFQGPFRFDRARNQALSHVPEDADWCFSVDIDEIFEPGWRAAIEKAAAENPDATQIKYPFVFTHRTDPVTGKEVDDHLFWKGNCHRRTGWRWVCPCHEVLISDLHVIEANAPGCRLHHRSLPKARRGTLYLELLQQGAKDDPKDARVHYYLGREYMLHGQWKEAADTLVKYLDLAGQYCWHDEKGNAIFYIASCLEQAGDIDRAESWALRALAETAGREPYLFLARIYHQQGRWWESKFYAEKALQIADNKAYFRDPSLYRAAPWDYISACAFKLGDRQRSKEAAAKCLEFDPSNERYRGNARFFGLLPPEEPTGGETGAKTPETDENGRKTGAFCTGNHASEREISGGIRRIPAEFPPENPNALAVAYSITANFTPQLEVALFSLLTAGNDVRDLYIIREGGHTDAEPLPPEGRPSARARISRLCKNFGVGRVHWLSLGRMLDRALLPDSPNRKPVCSLATLGRVFLAQETKEDKILYLDTDTIVMGSLAELWNTPLDGVALAGCRDEGAYKLWNDYTKTLAYGGIPQYLNAGVLLMNLKLIRQYKLDLHAISLLNRHYYNFADQDVLNIACRGRTRVLENRWNSGVACGHHPRPVIDHFVTYADFWKNPYCRSWSETQNRLSQYWTDRAAAGME